MHYDGDKDMVMINYAQQATELADVLCQRYASERHSERFTLWDHAFCWDGEALVSEERIIHPYRNLVPQLFARSSRELVKPDILVPKASSLQRHFSLLALANRDMVEEEYQALLTEGGYHDISGVLDLVSDRRLTQEAFHHYLQLKTSGALDEKVDVLDFLLRYDLQKGELTTSTRHPKGTYIYLTTRLVYRYGEERLEEGMFTLANGGLSDAVQKLHAQAKVENKKVSVDRSVVALYEKYAFGNGSSLEKPTTRTRVAIEGRRKVRLRGNSVSINWAVLAEARQRRAMTYQAFEPADVLLARAAAQLREKYLNKLKENDLNIAVVLGDIDQELQLASSAVEKRVLEDVRAKFELVGRFDGFDSINHHMPVTIIRKDRGKVDRDKEDGGEE